MSRRSYGQPTCGLANALDMLGERWTLLMIRELLMGPQRYSDLQQALPGLGTNLLADRLRHLEGIGVIEHRHLPPPVASAVYELTEFGQNLEEIVVGLANWGAQFTCEPCDATFEPRRQAFALFARLDRIASAHIDESYEYHIGPHTIHAHVRQGHVTATPAIGRRPDAVIITDAAGFCDLFERGAAITEMVAAGRLQVRGDTAVVTRSVSLFC